MARDDPDLLNPQVILQVYELGYFPMAESRDSQTIMWVLPDLRGVLEPNNARAPKRLLRLLRQEPFDVRIDTAFPEVISACAEAREGRNDTWISPAIERAFVELHRMGRAHSVECWRDGRLLGGLYGLTVGGVFCGESMFSRADNASKIAFLHLVARLKINEFGLLDTQFRTDHLTQFGVVEWPNEKYQRRLATLIGQSPDFRSGGVQLSTETVLQSMTQTS